MQLHPPFSISGETGATLGNALIPFETAGMEDAVLTLETLSISTLGFTLPSDTPFLPDRGQSVNLIDARGTRIFTGTARRFLDWETGAQKRWIVTVEDVFKQLSETPVTGSVSDESGASSVRPLVIYPTGDLLPTLLAFIARMQELGVPLDAGTVDECFPVPRMTFAKSTGAEALSDMMKWIADGTAWISYHDPGNPRLNVTRRGGGSNITLQLGSDTDDTSLLSLRDLPELQPLAVEVQSARRDAQGRVVFGKQVAGDPDAAAARTQSVVISGAENTDLLLGNDFEAYEITTDGDTLDAALVSALDTELASIKATHGSVPGGPATSVARWTGNIKGGSYADPQVFSAPTYLKPDGTAAATSGYNFIISPTPPSWVIAALGAYAITVRGTWAHGFTYPNGTSPVYTPAFTAMAETIGYAGWATEPTSLDSSRVNPGFRQYELRAWVYTGTAYPAPTVIYKPSDYDFIFPPDNLAEDLFRAQSFLPFNGRAILGPATVDFPIPGNTLSALGGDPLWETAGAMISATEFDLNKLSARLTLGTPPATSPTTLLDRFRSAARDNLAT